MPESLETIDILLSRAVEITDAAERDRFLREQCAGDKQLLQQVAGLADAHVRAAGFLEEPAATVALRAPEHGAGSRIGPYKLLEEIGEGGMGVVYMAEQTEPVKRRVALKIIKPGMDTREVIARFEAERQALALMDHPNIAKVLDAGTTGELRNSQTDAACGLADNPQSAIPNPQSSARPYFIMELVRGVPITEFCDAQKLSTRERLLLFVTVCRAVQHAHQKGVIHRDIKPGNVLVTLHDGVPVPKVIDFGVAKAIHQKLTEQTLFTRFAQIVGTPLYMSPEQAEMSGLDVDTRTDVYALGVLLYVLLTGTTPFDKETLKQAGFDEMRRIIREDDPPRPSARVSTLKAEALTTVCDRRKVDPRRLSHSLRGELDWIVMKALAKDRGRRYESASAFAADVERYLNDEPVQACPPSVWYRARKAMIRHKGILTTAVLVAVALCAGTGVSIWQAVIADDARGVAEERGKDLALALEREKSERNRAERNEKIARDEVEATTQSLSKMIDVTRYSLQRAQSAWASGDFGAAGDTFEKTAAFLRSAEKQLPTHELRLHTLAVCSDRGGDFRWSRGDHQRAVRWYRECIAQWDRMEKSQTVPALQSFYLWENAGVHRRLGLLLVEMGRPKDGAAVLKRAAGLLRRSAERAHGEPPMGWFGHRLRQAEVAAATGDALWAAGQRAQASLSYAKSIDLCARVIQEKAKQAAPRATLARILSTAFDVKLRC